MPDAAELLRVLDEEIVACRKCPRLVVYREAVAREKRRAYRDWIYWGKPVPGFGDPDAKLMLVGLAPGAHGSNRTGRPFTGDKSGEFLYRALYDAGFANRPVAVQRDDGLCVIECLHHGGGAVCAAGQQAAAERAGELPAVLGARAGDFEAAGDFGAGENWVGCLFGDFEGAGIYCFAGGVSVWAWG